MKFTYILILSIVLMSFKDNGMVKTKVNDAITISLPTNFYPMSEADIKTKYVSSKLPIAMYTDESRMVDLGINVAYSRWREEDFDMMKSFYKSNIMGLYDEVSFIDEKVEEINGKQFAVFEFIGSVKPEDKEGVNTEILKQYVYIQYTIVKYKTVLFNFSCPARIQDKWAPVAHKIMPTVKLSKKL